MPEAEETDQLTYDDKYFKTHEVLRIKEDDITYLCNNYNISVKYDKSDSQNPLDPKK